MRNPVRVNVATTRKVDGKTVKVEDLNQRTPCSLRAEYVVCSMEEKINQLVWINRLLLLYGAFILQCCCILLSSQSRILDLGK